MRELPLKAQALNLRNKAVAPKRTVKEGTLNGRKLRSLKSASTSS